MVSLELWGQLYAALPEDVQVIMLGDINQVPPVFGDSILCYALTKLPVIELLKVYRQALDSPIIANAHRVLRGEVAEFTFDFLALGKSANKTSQYRYSLLIADKLEKLLNEDKYSPEKDMLLSPWNKHDLGTININYLVAQFLTAKRKTPTHEIVIGVRKIYLSEGDKVLIRKQPGIIMRISPNYKYAGPAPKLASTNLTRWGFYKAGIEGIEGLEGMADIDMDSLELRILGKEALEQGMEEDEDSEEETLFRSSSHILKIILEDGTEKILREVGDFSPNIFQLGYCLTIHKSQGGEWPRVFVLTHKAHRQSLNRELLYTAITRAQKELFLIGDVETVKAATKIQKVKGNTLKEKIAWFSSGIKPLESIRFAKLAGQIEDIYR
jgi:exodeoxyribonuclease V alpha subunit